MTTRRQAALFGVAAALLIAAGVVYLVWASARVDEDIATREARALEAVEAFERTDSEAAAESGAVAETGGTTETEQVAGDEGDQQGAAATNAQATSDPLPAAGDVVVVHRVPGDDYGRLAIRHADGTRTLLERDCLRVYIAQTTGVCLAQDTSVLVPAWRTEFFAADQPGYPELRSYASPLPSRARVSPDGYYVSTTGFVSGIGYADIGGETETIVTVDAADGSEVLFGLVQFEVDADDPSYNAAGRQFWGVSFANRDDFWVTGWFGDEPEILKGNVARRLLEPTGWKGSCPALSPNGETLVFKESQPDGSYRLVAVDLASDRRWPLGETRSVDDQVEWLDDDTILYALHPDGADDVTVDPQFDIWSLDIAEGSEPEIFLPAADSPVVIRTN